MPNIEQTLSSLPAVTSAVLREADGWRMCEERLCHLLLINVTQTSLPRSAAGANGNTRNFACLLGDSGCATCGYYVIPFFK